MITKSTVTSEMTNLPHAQLKWMLPCRDEKNVTLRDGAECAKTGDDTWEMITRWIIDGHGVTLKATTRNAQLIHTMQWRHSMNTTQYNAHYASHIECARLCIEANPFAFFTT